MLAHSNITQALRALDENPQRLERARRRFEEDLPSPLSSGESTCLPSEHSEDRLPSLDLSLPYHQFMHQASRERQRLVNISDTTGKHPKLIDEDYDVTAHTNIRRRWKEQGIWPRRELGNTLLGDTPFGRWKHEEPFDSAFDMKTQPDQQFNTRTYPNLSSSSTAAAPCSESLEDILSSARDREERHVTYTRESEASRPYRQFLCQVTLEEQSIKHGTRTGNLTDTSDVKKAAFEAVKQDWMQFGIWDSEWGELPGLSWKHEERTVQPESSTNPQLMSAHDSPNPSQESSATAAKSQDSTAASARSRTLYIPAVRRYQQRNKVSKGTKGRGHRQPKPTSRTSKARRPLDPGITPRKSNRLAKRV